MLKIQGLLIFYKYVTLTIWVIDITRITNVFKTLKLWKNLNNLSYGPNKIISCAAIILSGIIFKENEINYIDNKTEKIINSLLDRSYYQSYNELDENTINFVMLKILNILFSINDPKLLIYFNESIEFLSLEDPNLEIRNYAKKVYNILKK